MNRHIVAVGGGGFSEDQQDTVLERYILALADKPNPKVCFVPTASGDSERYIDKFNTAFSGLECRRSVLSVFKAPTSDLRGFIMDQDVIHVGGGNTRCMLALWREWGLDRYLREALDNGIVLSGISAGSICWFEQGSTDSVPGVLTALECLGYIEGSCCPHYDSEPGRRPSFHRMIATGELKAGYAIDDYAAVHFVNGRLDSAIASRPGAGAWNVECRNGACVEEKLSVRELWG